MQQLQKYLKFDMITKKKRFFKDSFIIQYDLLLQILFPISQGILQKHAINLIQHYDSTWTL